jgi:HEAT repeat protein
MALWSIGILWYDPAEIGIVGAKPDPGHTGPRPPPDPVAKEMIEKVRPFLRSESADLRAEALASLGQMGATEDADDIAAFLSDDNPTVRISAVEALRGLRSKRHASLIAQRVSDEAWWIRSAAISALREFGAKEYAEIIARQVMHDDLFVAGEAILTLGDWGMREYKEEIAKALRHNEFMVRSGAIQTLVAFDAAEYSPDIAEQLDDPKNGGEAALALAKFGAREYVARIEELLRQPDYDDPWARDNKGRFALALAILGAGRNADEIARLLKHEHYWVRGKAAQALGVLKAKKYVRQVAALLDDPKTRKAGAEALNAMFDGPKVSYREAVIPQEAVRAIEKAKRNWFTRYSGLGLLIDAFERARAVGRKGGGQTPEPAAPQVQPKREGAQQSVEAIEGGLEKTP